MSLTARQSIACGLVALAAILWAFEYAGNQPAPGPAPTPSSGLSLRGLFVGPSAADDAAIVSSLTDEIGNCLQHDGTLESPRLKTGVQFDDLRIAAREARCRGESIGARQPKVRDAIHSYLDATVGTSGGPISPQDRAKWVSAMKEISRAAADASK